MPFVPDASTPQPPHRPWAQQRFALIVAILLTNLFGLLELASRESDATRGWSLLSTYALFFAQVAFIQVDCFKRNRTTSFWPVLSYLMGPFALWAYLLITRGAWGIVAIAGSVFIYVAVQLPLWIVTLLLQR